MTSTKSNRRMIQLLRLAAVAFALLLAVVVVVKRMPGAPLHVVSRTGLQTHYLLDYEYLVDTSTGEAIMGHLVVLNPGDVDADLQLKVYFEDRAPVSFEMTAAARASM